MKQALARELRPKRIGVSPRTCCSAWRRILIFAVAVLAIVPRASWPQEIVTLTGDPWPPYVAGAVGSQASGGIAVALVKEIFARIDDVDVSFPLIPWKRALMEVEQGTKDGIVMLLKTPERERYMRYTEPLLTSHSLIWYSKRRFPDGFKWTNLVELNRYRLGKTRGYSYGEEVDRLLKSGSQPVVEVRSVEQLFTMLARGRIDLALANDGVGYVLAERHASSGSIVPAEKPTGMEVHHLSLSRKSKAVRLIPQINRIIVELREEGLVEQLKRQR